MPSAMIRPMALYGGIDLGGTKIQAAILDDDHEVLGASRRPTPTTGGPADVAAEIVRALREAGADCEDRAVGAGRRRRRLARHDQRRQRCRRTQPSRAGKAPIRSRARSRTPSAARCASATTFRLRPMPSSGSARARVRLAARRLLGHGCGRRADPRLDGLDRPGRGRRDRTHGRQGRRRALHVWAIRVRRGVRRPRGDGGARAQAARGEGTQDRPLQADGETRRTRLTSGIWSRALEHGDELATEVIDRAVAALGAGIASALNLLDVEAVVIGGGLGVRLGESYANRINAAMLPHLFADFRPPPRAASRRWATSAARSAPRCWSNSAAQAQRPPRRCVGSRATGRRS